jgi:lysozyme family protein
MPAAKDSKFEDCLAFILRKDIEGGYVNHPKDPGGETDRGVTKRVYDAYRKRKGLPARNVRKMTHPELKEIYRQHYWDVVRGDELPPGIDLMTFDMAVNSGPARAARHLQSALGVKPDGIIGNMTLAAARECEQRDQEHVVIAKMAQSRLNWLDDLSTWKTFGKGWTRRVRTAEKVAGQLETKADIARQKKVTRVVEGAANLRVVPAAEPAFEEPSQLYNPEVQRHPEPEKKAQANSKWAMMFGGGGLIGMLVQLWNDIRLSLDNLFEPWVISIVLIFISLGFGFYAWSRAKEARNNFTSEAQQQLME